MDVVSMGDIYEREYVQYHGKINNIITAHELFEKTNILIGKELTSKDIAWLSFFYKSKQILVADRNIKTMISWENIDDQSCAFGKEIIINDTAYKVRLLTSAEWDKLIVHSNANDDSNWREAYSWCQNIYSMEYLHNLGLTHRIIRGNEGSEALYGVSKDFASYDIGWRPTLERI
jgi:hypothetical protein